MINYGQMHSMVRPKEIEITDTAVFIANNITSNEVEIDDHNVVEYVYDLISYDKNEYLEVQNEKIASLEQELQATKILLGVD